MEATLIKQLGVEVYKALYLVVVASTCVFAFIRLFDHEIRLMRNKWERIGKIFYLVCVCFGTMYNLSFLYGGFEIRPGSTFLICLGLSCHWYLAKSVRLVEVLSEQWASMKEQHSHNLAAKQTRTERIR